MFLERGYAGATDAGDRGRGRRVRADGGAAVRRQGAPPQGRDRRRDRGRRRGRARARSELGRCGAAGADRRGVPLDRGAGARDAQARSAGLVLAVFEGSSGRPRARRAVGADERAARRDGRMAGRRAGPDGPPAAGVRPAGSRRHAVGADGPARVRPARSAAASWTVEQLPGLVRPRGRPAADRRLVDPPPDQEETRHEPRRRSRHGTAPHGQIGYLQLPALDIARSAAFYERSSAGRSSSTTEASRRPG